MFTFLPHTVHVEGCIGSSICHTTYTSQHSGSNICHKSPVSMDASSGSTDPLPPSWFWKWLETASQEALDAAQQAISTEKQARLDEEKTRALQFWAEHPVPCNRCCMYHDEQGRRCPCPCAHTASSPEADMMHSVSEWRRCARHWYH